MSFKPTFQDILDELTRYGGEPKVELLPILDAVVDINDDMNHGCASSKSLAILYKACDAFKDSIKAYNFWAQFSPLTKHMFVGTLSIDKHQREFRVSPDKGRRLGFELDPEEFESQMQPDGWSRFLGQRVLAIVLVDRHCVRGILTNVVQEESGDKS